MKRRIFKFIISLIVLLALLFTFKIPVLRGFGNFLIYENDFEQVETAFVLSGQAFDRGNTAADLYQNKKIKKIICTGENQPPAIKVFGSSLLESDLTKLQILKVLDSTVNVTVLPIGTSTLEECEAILNYCKTKSLTECAIVSSLFHTKRVKDVFLKKFRKNGIQVFIKGAPSSVYNEQFWWENEYGLLAVNNEYIKLLYYLLK